MQYIICDSNHIDLCQSFETLSLYYISNNMLEKAETPLIEALNILLHNYNSEHQDIGILYYDIGVYYYLVDKYFNAFTYFKKSSSSFHIWYFSNSQEWP